MNSFLLALSIRIVAVATTVFLMLWLPFPNAILLFYTLGLSHFLLAFLYQRDAGKWNARKFLLILGGFLGLVLLGMASPYLLVFSSAFIFVFHMMSDEVHLLRKKHSVYTGLEMLPFVILYTGILFETLFYTSVFIPSLILAGVAFLIYAVVALRTKRMPDAVSFMSAFWTLFALGAYFFLVFYGPVVAPILWFLGLTVMHYLIWYGEYWRRVSADVSRRRTYVVRVIAANVFFFILAYFWVQRFAPLALLFAPLFFYIWSFLHIVSSVRLADVRAWFGRS